MRHARIANVICGGLLAASVSTVNADDDDRGGRHERIRAVLTSVQEVPAISSAGRGRFEARLDRDAGVIEYELRFSGLEADVLQAHIHFGQRHTNGGISVFLCSNLGNGPVGTQPCPNAPATITGSISAASVIGPAGQGIDAGSFDELLAAIRGNDAYVNVHTVKYPGGEIRGQVF